MGLLKVMAAAQAGDPAALSSALRRQRAYLLTELRSLGAARSVASQSPVTALLVTAAELHIRADLGVVDAAERELRPDVVETMRIPAAGSAAPPQPPGAVSFFSRSSLPAGGQAHRG